MSEANDEAINNGHLTEFATLAVMDIACFAAWTIVSLLIAALAFQARSQ